jgi:hypothetical protein
MAIIDLHEQTKSYSCGAACLRNALMILGNKKKERAVRHAARTSHKGTDEVSLKQAAEKFGYRLEEFLLLEKDKGVVAYRWLLGELKKNRPVLLCVDDFSHWVLAIGILDRRIAIADPAVHDQRQAFGLYTRGGLLKRWWIDDPDKMESSQYFGMSLFPESPLARKRALKALRLAESVLRTLQRDDDTDIYDAARDLTRIFSIAKRHKNGGERIEAGDFLARHEEDILGAVGYWHSESDLKLLKPVYQTYQDVASALDYSVPGKLESKVLVELTALIAGLVEKG